jgi:hypothetical protein
MRMYRIAIPTYKRAKTIKTLSYLEECGVDMSIVDLFMANEEEYNDYLEAGIKARMIIGVKGIREQREFIRDYYEQGQMVLSMDDDISGLYKLVGDKLQKVTNLDGFVKSAFMICKMNKTKIWGVTAVNNPFYMKESVSTDLKFIVGCFYGFINDKDPFFKVSEELKVKEDYELTIKHFIKYGKVVRFNGYSPKTKYYTEPGGLQGERNKVDSEEASSFLLQKYPEYVRLKGIGSNGHMEIGLKNNRTK